MNCGGYTGQNPARAKTQELVDSVKDHLAGHIGKQSSKYQAIAEKSQLVNGINHRIKVQLDDQVIHVGIYSSTYKLDSYITRK